MEKIRVDQKTPPAMDIVPSWMGVIYWERSRNPLGLAAMKDIPVGKKVYHFIVTATGFKVPEERDDKDGWAGIDFAENVVCFVADGSETTAEVYTIQKGPHGHTCAYPEGSEERIATHQEWIRRKENENGCEI